MKRQKHLIQTLLARCRAWIGRPTDWCEQMLADCKAPVTQCELELKRAMPEGGLEAALAGLQESGIAVSAGGGTWVHRDVLHETGVRMLAAIEAFHRVNQQRAGVNCDELAAILQVDVRLLNLAASPLLEAKQIQRNRNHFAQAGWSPRLSDRDRLLCDQIAAKLQMSRFGPPGIVELAAALEEPPPRITAMLHLLVERGLLVQLTERIWIHRLAFEAACQTALKLFQKSSGFSAEEFGKALGVGSRHTGPLLEYFDKTRFTVQMGNRRTPGVDAKRFLTSSPR